MKKILASLFFLAALISTFGARADSGATSADLLSKVSRDAESYGELINQGTILPLKGDRSKPLYFFERRVKSEGAEIVSTSFTHDGQKPVLIELAAHDTGYKVREFTENQFQLGKVSKMTVEGNKLRFYSLAGGKEKSAEETLGSLPLVVGPTFYGFVYNNWDSLMAGKTVKFRYCVLARMETVGFELKKTDSAANQIRIQMKPTSFVISLLVDPIHFTFLPDKTLVSLEGRVPPKIKKGDDWADLDAYEIYKSVAPAFR